MSWYNTCGKENDVVISSRIRFARNIVDYPFGSNLDETSCNEIIEKVSKALGDEFETIDFKNISQIDAGELVEKHYVSREFAKKQKPHILLANEKKDVSVMVCEEDHIRLQCIMSGLSLDEAYKNACIYDDILDDNLNIAFDEKLGYLTHCPTNLGLGMRASVMMFLPALTMTRSMEKLSLQLSNLGLTVRGMYGEGSDPDGCLYQISNRVTMGVTEDETLKKMNDIVKQICEKERRAREVLKSDNYSAIADKVGRAYGILKYARIISSKEFMKLYADVRLGISLGIIDDLTYEKMGEIMIGVLPANLIKNNGGKPISDYERDILRADYLRKAIG
ncbi:MAG: protein arginine kinase [Ruminococcaceae bacterium]|nr:protein arginine kinase [Oscillospiraceae bacterium]